MASRQVDKARSELCEVSVIAPPLHVVALRPLQVLALLSWLVMFLVPVVLFHREAVLRGRQEAERAAQTAAYHVALAGERLVRISHLCAQLWSGGGSAIHAARPGDIQLRLERVPAEQAAAYAGWRAWTLERRGGEPYMVARCGAVRASSGVIVEASRPVRAVLESLSQRQNIRIEIGPAEQAALRPRTRTVLQLRSPRVVATAAVRDGRGKPVASLTVTVPLTDEFVAAWGSAAINGAIGLIVLALLLWESNVRASQVRRVWRDVASEVAAVAAGELDRPLPVPPCCEGQMIIRALDELRTRLIRRDRQIADTAKLQTLLSHSYDEAELASIMWHFASRAGFEKLEILRIDSSRAHVRLVLREAVKSLGSPREELRAPTQCICYRQAASFVVEDTRSEYVCRTCVASRERSYMCVPMMSRGTIIGVLRVASSRPGAFSGDLGNLAAAYAGMLSSALDNTYLLNELREATMRDPLTGLYNRRFLDEYLARKQAEVDPEEDRVAVLMMDLDHFKQFNDTYGHEAGDIALRAVATCLRRNVRPDAICCRYGGEELAVIVEGVGVGEGVKVAERLRRAIESEAIRLPDRLEPLHVTVSIGVAVYPEHAASLIEAVHAADEALYEAKRAGRNAVRVYSGPGEEADKQAA